MDLWSEILDRLEPHVSTRALTHWFADTRLLSQNGAELQVFAPSATIARWLDERYRAAVERVASELKGVPTSVRFLTEAPPTPVATELQFEEKYASSSFAPGEVSISQSISGQAAVGTQLPLPQSPLVDWYTFDTYIAGPTNEVAYAAARAVAEAPGAVYNPLFLWGSVGLGKTHLMQAIGNHLRATQPNKLVLYVTCEQFTNDFIRCVREKTMDQFQRRYRDVDLLLIDDIQFLSRTKATQEEFFHTFNALYLSRKQIVLTSDRPPQELALLQDRLRSRFEHGVTLDIQPPVFEMRVAILTKKAQRLGMTLPEDVAMYLANLLTLNVRQLEGCLTTLFAAWSLRRQPITLSLAREVVSNFLTEGKRVITFDLIMEEVSREYGVSPDLLVGKRRTQPEALARQIVMSLAQELTGMSTTEIARHLGNRDHSTIVHGIHKVKHDLSEDSALRERVERIRLRLIEEG